MPDWLRLALVITSLCTPGIVLMAVRGVRSLRAMVGHDPDLPRPSLLMIGSATQNLVGVFGMAAAGCWALDRARLEMPVFEAITTGDASIDTLVAQIVPGALGGVLAAVMVLGLYYGWARRTIDRQALARIEHMRLALGLSTRMLFAGMSEEVLFRLGVMTLLAWGFTAAFGAGNGPTVAAISVSALVFAGAHVPAIVAAGVKLDATLVLGTLGLNTIAGLVFGALYWKFGLLAAMIAHASFHLIWWPFEVRFQTVAPPSPGFEWIGDGRIGEGG
jgi:hypothetical protein